MCGFKSTPEKCENELDAHHIQNRDLMPNGGYVKENGISLCAECHIKAEEFHNGREPPTGFSPWELFIKIGSSLEKATAASQRL